MVFATVEVVRLPSLWDNLLADSWGVEASLRDGFREVARRTTAFVGDEKREFTCRSTGLSAAPSTHSS